MSKPTWSYGVTTVPSRIDNLLPQTLESLKAAGFPSPRLFIDGCKNPSIYDKFGLEYTSHSVNMRTFGNWVTALWELYVRDPKAGRYVIFQDDIITYKNLRDYLDTVSFGPNQYWNLYTYPVNHAFARKDNPNDSGFFQSNQQGKGALALVFDREGVLKLLGHEHMLKRPQDAARGHRSIDGGIVDTMRKQGCREMIHLPSLVQHIGTMSSMGNGLQELADTFRGENFDATELIKEH